MNQPPCTCMSCANDPLLLTGVGEHSYRLDTDEQNGAWRWRCACGGRGRWQWQSDNVAFHSWRVHAGLEVRP